MSKRTIKKVKKMTQKDIKHFTIFKANTIIIALILIAVIAVSIVGYNYLNESGNAILTGLTNRVDKLGNLVDPMNEIGVQGVEDVSYYYKLDGICLNFGKYKIDLSSDIRQKELEQLKMIGITVGRDKNGEYVFKYKGEKITRLADGK